MNKTYIFDCGDCKVTGEEFRVESSDEKAAEDLMNIHHNKRHSTTQSIVKGKQGDEDGVF